MISDINNITQPKIKLSKRLHQQSNNSNPNFKGPVDGVVNAATGVLNFLNTSPAIGACFVDFAFMVTPRTAVDFKRSVDAGVETGIREGSGTLNHAAAGMVGLAAATAVSHSFNKANGIKAHLMFMDGNTIDAFKDFINVSKTEAGYDAKVYWEKFFQSIRGLNTSGTGDIWKSIDNTVKDAEGKTQLNKLVDLMTTNEAQGYKVSKETMAKVAEIVTGDTGAGSTFQIERIAGKAEKFAEPVKGSLENLVNNAHSMRRAVLDKVAHDKTVHVNDIENFIKGIKNRKLATVAAGLAIPVAIGMSVQPINRLFTKKRTGSEGFVGVEGREPDKSFGFKVLKTAVGLAMGSAMVATILEKPTMFYTNIKKAVPEIISKLQYKGKVPTMDQFKLIYGLTIMSRMFAARDKNEVRESAIKDTLGFANWLILGGFVSKLAARGFKKDLINYNKAVQGGGFISKAVEKTHEEILYPALKKMGISVLDANGKKLPFRKLMKLMTENAKGTAFESLAKETSSRLRYKNYAQLLGYVYSGLVLGIGIPKLNIAITKRVEKNRAAKEAQVTDNQADKMKLSNDFMKQLQNDNKTFGAFLSQIQ